MKATGIAQWAKILPEQLVTNDKFKDYSFWSMSLEVDDKEKKRLIKDGFKPYYKNGSEETNIFKFQRRETTRAGKTNKPPKIVDASMNPWDRGEIGNGSKVVVQFYEFDHEMASKAGLGKILNAVQVISHVPHVTAGLDEFTAVEEEF